MTQTVDLSAVVQPVKANAGDDVYLPFVILATDTTNWTLLCPIYVANSTNSGPSGSPIGSATVTNTPSTNSQVNLSIAGTLTSPYSGKSLWFQLTKTNPAAWIPSTVYSVSQQVINGGNVYTCTSGGTSAASGGPTGTGTGITDGTVTWNYVAAIGTVRTLVVGPLTLD